MTTKGRSWIIDVVVGGIIGAIVGAVIAVNVVIYAGPDEGYESSLSDVFDHNAVVGTAALAVLVAGPIAGVVIARRTSSRRKT